MFHQIVQLGYQGAAVYIRVPNWFSPHRPDPDCGAASSGLWGCPQGWTLCGSSTDCLGSCHFSGSCGNECCHCFSSCQISGPGEPCGRKRLFKKDVRNLSDSTVDVAGEERLEELDVFSLEQGRLGFDARSGRDLIGVGVFLIISFIGLTEIGGEISSLQKQKHLVIRRRQHSLVSAQRGQGKKWWIETAMREMKVR